MNIEQIAKEVARGMYFEGIARGAAEYPAEFLRRCLSKLAERCNSTAALNTVIDSAMQGETE